jgi:hypothetical protein
MCFFSTQGNSFMHDRNTGSVKAPKCLKCVLVFVVYNYKRLVELLADFFIKYSTPISYCMLNLSLCKGNPVQL